MAASRPVRPLHVLLIHQLFVTTGQPGGTRHFELAKHWVERGARVTVIAGRRSYLTGKAHPADGALPEGMHVIRVGVLPFDGGGFPLRVANFVAFMVRSFFLALRVEGVDLVVGTSPPIFQAAAGAVAARLRGVPFLLEVRDLWPDFAVELGVLRARVLIGASKALERWLYRSADRIVVNSPGFLPHVGERGRPPPIVVPNGVDCGPFDPTARGRGFRESHGFEEDFLVVYAGAHGVPNDLSRVLDASALVEDPRVRWVLIGDGREKARLEADAAARGLTRVSFLEPVSKEGMPEVLAAADLTLAVLAPLPLFRTVYPNKVFDYMAAGRPVLLAIDGAIREVVELADAGTFVPPGRPEALAEAVRWYREHPDKGRVQGKNGRRFVEEHFRRDSQAAAFFSVLHQLATAR